MSNYVEKHLTTINDLFDDFNVDKVHGKGNVKRKYKCSDKKALARKIFLRYLYNLMWKLTDGGATFVFPTRAHMEIRWRKLPDTTFKKARAAGYLGDVDILMSNFTYYEMVLYYKAGGYTFYKPIKLSDNFRQKLLEKVNSGYKYC